MPAEIAEKNEKLKEEMFGKNQNIKNQMDHLNIKIVFFT